MRVDFIASASGHAAVLLMALIVLATPRQIDQPPAQTVEVDVVRENEVAEAAKDMPKIDLPREAPADRPAPGAPAQAKDAPAPSKAAPAPSKDTPAPSKEAQSQAMAAAPRPQDPFPGPSSKPVYFPMLLPSREGVEGDFDAPADTAAGLSREEIARLQAHLQKCWKGPAAQEQNVRVVLRVALSAKGALLADPMLVKASASALGPPLVESARRALRQCQPFGFLPPEKYEDWKLLELTFSPAGLAPN
jgi:hypothetical protein